MEGYAFVLFDPSANRIGGYSMNRLLHQEWWWYLATAAVIVIIVLDIIHHDWAGLVILGAAFVVGNVLKARQ